MVRIPKAQGVGAVKNLEIKTVTYRVSNASVEQEAILTPQNLQTHLKARPVLSTAHAPYWFLWERVPGHQNVYPRRSAQIRE